MSLVSRLQTALSVVFILTTAGAISVTAQTQAVADSLSTDVPATAASTSEPKKAESKKPPTTPAENTAPDTSAVSRDAGNASPAATAGAPTATAKTTTLSESEAPRSPQTADPDKWQFQFSPYLWLAGLHGTTGTSNRTVLVDESFSDVFHSLKFAFMGLFEARKGKFVSLTDLEYISLEDDRATPGPLFGGVNAKIKQFIFDPEVGYRVYDDPDKGAFVDVLGGVRVWHLSTDFTFAPGILAGTQVQASRNWVDAVGGLRGRAALSEKFFVSGKFDLGGGGSKFTYQLFGGGGYSLNKNIALLFGYRVIDVNYDKNNFIYDVNQRGPILGVGFKF